MNATQIAQATGLPRRRVSYVLEHRVLPGSEKASRGARFMRHFRPLDAFGIAVCTALLEAGLRRQFVRDCVATLVRRVPGDLTPLGIPLNYAFHSVGPTHVLVGDAVNVRLEVSSTQKPLDTGWLQAATGAKVADGYSPLVQVSVDVGRLRKALKDAEAAQWTPI